MASRHPLLGPSLTIDCARCPVQHVGCADCVVTALLSTAPVELVGTVLALDADERRAVDGFARAGLISPATATAAVARPTREEGRRAVG